MGGDSAADGVVAPGGAPATGPAAAVGKGETGGGGGLNGHFCLLRLVIAAGQRLISLAQVGALKLSVLSPGKHAGLHLSWAILKHLP